MANYLAVVCIHPDCGKAFGTTAKVRVKCPHCSRSFKLSGNRNGIKPRILYSALGAPKRVKNVVQYYNGALISLR